jgi:hypothetical protein
MDEVDVLEEVMRIHRTAPWPPSAAEVLMAASEGVARSQAERMLAMARELLADAEAVAAAKAVALHDLKLTEGQRQEQLDRAR